MNGGSLAMLVALLAGALAGLGVWLVVLGLLRRPPAPPRSRRKTRIVLWWKRQPAWRQWGILGSFVAGVGVALVTGITVAVVAIPGAMVLLPPLFMGSGEAARIARMNGIAKWTRNLANLQVAGSGLEGAINMTKGESAPVEIRAEVTRLANRLNLPGMDTATALKHFADDLDDYTGDLVAASLMLGARERGPGLAAVLTRTADSVDEQVRARLDIETDRIAPRKEARWITVIGLVIAAGVLMSGQVSDAYRTPVGQIILLVLVVGFGASVWWMRRIGQLPEAPRFAGHDVEMKTVKVVEALSEEALG
jgi:hypothetical protein